MENEDFQNQIKELFRLFKKLVEKEDLNNIPGVDKDQIEQLKLFLSQYNEVKDQMSLDLLGQVDPFTKQMIGVFITKLREQLGNEADDEEVITAEEIVAKKEEELKTVPDKQARIETLIATIDKQLTNPNLTEDEINVLLDKRSQLVSSSCPDNQICIK